MELNDGSEDDSSSSSDDSFIESFDNTPKVEIVDKQNQGLDYIMASFSSQAQKYTNTEIKYYKEESPMFKNEQDIKEEAPDEADSIK